jgi:hypothetical protein
MYGPSLSNGLDPNTGEYIELIGPPGTNIGCFILTDGDWTITIINDEDFVVRNAFERWMNGINSHNLNVRNPIASTPLGYAVDGQVTQFGKAGDTIKQYKFVGLFPTDVTPIDVDWGSNDAIEEFSVTMSYQWWEAVTDGVI